uniref:Tantalus domain-containing protein n=1 Tax=Syphacia muris TaxID=451379 RepID=A0A0N5A878_9BILA
MTSLWKKTEKKSNVNIKRLQDQRKKLLDDLFETIPLEEPDSSVNVHHSKPGLQNIGSFKLRKRNLNDASPGISLRTSRKGNNNYYTTKKFFSIRKAEAFLQGIHSYPLKIKLKKRNKRRRGGNIRPDLHKRRQPQRYMTNIRFHEETEMMEQMKEETALHKTEEVQEEVIANPQRHPQTRQKSLMENTMALANSLPKRHPKADDATAVPIRLKMPKGIKHRKKPFKLAPGVQTYVEEKTEEEEEAGEEEETHRMNEEIEEEEGELTTETPTVFAKLKPLSTIAEMLHSQRLSPSTSNNSKKKHITTRFPVAFASNYLSDVTSFPVNTEHSGKMVISKRSVETSKIRSPHNLLALQTAQPFASNKMKYKVNRNMRSNDFVGQDSAIKIPQKDSTSKLFSKFSRKSNLTKMLLKLYAANTIRKITRSSTNNYPCTITTNDIKNNNESTYNMTMNSRMESNNPPLANHNYKNKIRTQTARKDFNERQPNLNTTYSHSNIASEIQQKNSRSHVNVIHKANLNSDIPQYSNKLQSPFEIRGCLQKRLLGTRRDLSLMKVRNSKLRRNKRSLQQLTKKENTKILLLGIPQNFPQQQQNGKEALQ